MDRYRAEMTAMRETRDALQLDVDNADYALSHCESEIENLLVGKFGFCPSMEVWVCSIGKAYTGKTYIVKSMWDDGTNVVLKPVDCVGPAITADSDCDIRPVPADDRGYD